MDNRQQAKTESRRVSPGGLITLPFVARLALGFEKGQPKNLTAKVVKKGVLLSPSEGAGEDSSKASPRGQYRLNKEAHAALAEGNKGRYSLDIYDDRHSVLLQPA